jgi:predicted nucleic acid-binding protein
MNVLVDTNVLLRRTQPNHAHHAMAMESVARLLAAGENVCFTSQNISEFWNVVTRPIVNNGLGFPVSLALGEVEKIEPILMLLPTLPRSARNGSAWSSSMACLAQKFMTRGWSRP